MIPGHKPRNQQTNKQTETENDIIDSLFDVFFAFVISLLFYFYYKLNVTNTVIIKREHYPTTILHGDEQATKWSTL